MQRKHSSDQAGLDGWQRESPGGACRFYSGGQPTVALECAQPEVRAWTNQQTKRCALHYIAFGWVSYLTGDIEELDTTEQLSRLPEDYDAGIWTDAAEVIRPAVQQGKVGR